MAGGWLINPHLISPNFSPFFLRVNLVKSCVFVSAIKCLRTFTLSGLGEDESKYQTKGKFYPY